MNSFFVSIKTTGGSTTKCMRGSNHCRTTLGSVWYEALLLHALCAPRIGVEEEAVTPGVFFFSLMLARGPRALSSATPDAVLN